MALIVFALLALWISVTVLTPVFAAMRVVHSVTRGDLTMCIEDTRVDETGQLLGALRDMIGAVSAARTEKQAAALEQT